MNRIALILYISVLSAIFAPASVGQRRAFPIRSAAESMLVDAVQDYENGDVKTAVARLSAITEAFPDNDAAHYYLALCFIKMEETPAAVSELREASRLDPDNYWYRDNLAALYAMTGETALAVEQYENLLKDYPKKTGLYYSLVNLYARQNRLDKMIEALDNIDMTMGRDEQTVLARYDILMHQDKAGEAFQVLEDFNDEFPSPQILSMMGDARLSAGNDSLALECYDRALGLDSAYAPALLGKAEAYRMQRLFGRFFETLARFTSDPSIPSQMKSEYLSELTGRMDGRFFQTYSPQLDTLFETGMRAHPADSSMLLAAGTYYYRTERRDRGVELFKENSELYPDDFNSRAMYIQSLSYNNDWDTLLTASEEAFRAFPEEPAFLNMRVMAYYSLGDLRSVIGECTRMTEVFKSNPDVVVQALSTIGDSYHQMEDEKEAFKAYEKALKVNPTYAPVLNNYAYYLSIKGKKLAKAASMSKVTVEQEPDNATYLDTYGWILHLQKKSQEAKPYFKHAMLYGGKDNATILDHYAEVLYALGEYDLAKVYWDQAVKKDTDNEIPDLAKRVEQRLKAVGK